VKNRYGFPVYVKHIAKFPKSQYFRRKIRKRTDGLQVLVFLCELLC